MNEVTLILSAAAGGDSDAARQLLPLVYEELRKLAEARLAKTPPGNTLQPTALVHEAYLRLIGSADPGWQGRNHFFGAAAQAMRDILVEQARRKARLKHGGGRARLELDDVQPVVEPDPREVLAVDEALAKLEKEDPRGAQVVVLRYFGGLTEPETAAILDVSESTVVRDWKFARTWLFREFRSAHPELSDGESSP
ncbi:MAG: sigma-70 family RNA polymerase sigma factor [Planctomycetes bacterium]|nr:sigma-70 family RNA polymerase sigma factor [Planctomycetota bacterium]